MHRVTLLFAALIASTFLPGMASAHAVLKTTAPPVGSIVHIAPAQITIKYAEAVEPRFSSIVVQDTSGTRMETDRVWTAPNDDKSLVVALKPLKPGSYKVIWQVTSRDTHKTKGTYTFTVTP